jgi:hypothetical protein
MQKTALTLAVIAAVFAPDLLAVDMTNVTARAADLNMKKNDYAFAMAITGALSGTLFGLFLWKVK